MPQEAKAPIRFTQGGAPLPKRFGAFGTKIAGLAGIQFGDPKTEPNPPTPKVASVPNLESITPVNVPTTAIDMGTLGDRSAVTSNSTVPDVIQNEFASAPAGALDPALPAPLAEPGQAEPVATNPQSVQGNTSSPVVDVPLGQRGSGPTDWVNTHPGTSISMEPSDRSIDDVDTGAPIPPAELDVAGGPPAAETAAPPTVVPVVPVEEVPPASTVPDAPIIPVVPDGSVAAEPVSNDFHGEAVEGRRRGEPQIGTEVQTEVVEPEMPNPTQVSLKMGAESSQESPVKKKTDGIATLLYNSDPEKYLEMDTDGKLHLKKSLLRQEATALKRDPGKMATRFPELKQDFDEVGVDTSTAPQQSSDT